MSLAQFLRVLVSYWHVHDLCMSAKYLQAFVYVAACMEPTYFSAHEQCKRVSRNCYACSCAQICLHCYNPSSGLLVNPSIPSKRTSLRIRSKAPGNVGRSIFHVVKYVQQQKCDYYKQCTLLEIL